MFIEKFFKKITYLSLFLFWFVFLIYGIFCTEKGSINPIDPIQKKMLFFSSFSISDRELNIGEKIEIQTSLINGKGEKVVGQKVMFFSSSAIGSHITEYGYTDTSGIVAVQYTTGKNAGMDTIIVRTNDEENRTVSDSLFIKINMFGNLKLTSAEQVIYADGISETEIIAELRDIEQNAISGKTISFSASVGEIENSKITDNLGVAKVVFTGVASNTDITSVITASIESEALGKIAREQTAKSLIVDTLNILLNGITLELTPSNSSIFSDGVSKTTITAKLNTTSGSAISSKIISFATNLGNLSSSEAITDSAGTAKIDITSPTETGQATITASYGSEISGSTYVNFIEVLPEEPSFIEFTTQNNLSLPADGTSDMQISVKVLDRYNQPSDNQTVYFYNTSGTISLQSQRTDANGIATVTFTTDASNQDQTAKIIASVEDIAADTLYILQKGITFTLKLQSYRIVANGRKETEITAELNETVSKIPVQSGTVGFVTTKGSITLSADVSNGTAVAVLTSPSTSGTGTITATFGNTLKTNTDVFFYDSVPATISLSSSVNEINAKGLGLEETADITAVVMDVNDDKVKDNTLIIFSTTLGTFPKGTNTEEVYTFDGEAKTTLFSGNDVGGAYISARGDLVFAGRTLVWIKGAIPAESIEIEADTNNITIENNFALLNVTAIVKDTVRGNPVEDGTIVEFSLDSLIYEGAVIESQGTTEDGITTVVLRYLISKGGLEDVLITAQIRKEDGTWVSASTRFTLPIR